MVGVGYFFLVSWSCHLGFVSWICFFGIFFLGLFLWDLFLWDSFLEFVWWLFVLFVTAFLILDSFRSESPLFFYSFCCFFRKFYRYCTRDLVMLEGNKEKGMTAVGNV